MILDKGSKLRLIIHNVLFEICCLNKNLNDNKIKNLIDKNSDKDIAFITNVTLNSMRYSFHCEKIIKKYIKKNIKIHEKLLLISSITQLIYLDFKHYAVINCTVEVAKKLNIYHGFINAVLKKILSDKKKLKKTYVTFNDLPIWFTSLATDITLLKRQNFTNNFFKEPNIHLVFKDRISLLNFDQEIVKTSKNSGFLKNGCKIEKIKSYEDGNWWVQDYSSFAPLNFIENEIIGNSCIDLCSAPGGKSFQILSKNKAILLNDKSKNKIRILKENLERLRFKAKISNFDVLKMKSFRKFDFIVLDAPCSSIGTIRKNPEIFFKKQGPNFRELISLQKKLLEKSSKLLNEGGIIIYMVCSFLKQETVDQINFFLNNNTSFSLEKFKFRKDDNISKDIVNDMYIYTIPSKYKGYNIDGFFAACLKKNK